MTKNQLRTAPLLLPLCAAALLSACVAPAYHGDAHYAARGRGHVVYTTLPTTFVGGAYYYNGRYYSGGHYQTGRYNDRGRYYTTRYYHNGHYYYGGHYQQHAAKDTRQEARRTEDRHDRR